MLERGDLVAVHEPFCYLTIFGEVDVDGRKFTSADSLLAWLHDCSEHGSVFLKDTTDYRYAEVLADRKFLAEARHAFLIRRPEEIAASFFALQPQLTDNSIGLEALYELYVAVHDAGGHPVVIDSDDLADRPEATMAAYFGAVGLPFIARSLAWEPGERQEWQRSARWHAQASVSSGFERRRQRYVHTVDSSEELARLAARHRPFYEELHAARLEIAQS